MVKFLRITFLLLILVNLLFFAWTQGYFGDTEDGRKPQRLSSQLEPEKLRVNSIESPLPEAVEACRLISGLALADAQRLHAQAQTVGKFPGLTLVVKPVGIPPGYWVFLPPQPNRATADKKLAELKRRGIAHYFLVLDEGIDKLSISLGMFNSKQAADDYLRVLTGKGVRSAMVQLRTRPPEKAQLEARGIQDVLLKQLPELLAGAGMVGTSVGECPGEQ